MPLARCRHQEPADMSNNRNPDAQKPALTEQVIANLQSRLGAAKARMATRYAQQCFRRVPMEDLAAEEPSTLATIVLRQLEFIGRRKRSSCSASGGRGRWLNRRTIVGWSTTTCRSWSIRAP
jgi:hypothetical protein